MSKIDTVIWANDFSNTTGEGLLGRKFIDLLFFKKNKLAQLKSYEKLYLIGNKKVLKNIIPDNSFYGKYVWPFFGVLYLWLNLSKKNIIYLNYLPLWNFLIFLLLPKKTILGPITGGNYDGRVNNINLFLRKYIFPILYKISLFIIYTKFKKVIFSTDLLKKNISKKKINLFLFNFVFIFFSQKIKKKNRNFDIIFYNRSHIMKNVGNIQTILNQISSKYKISIIGDSIKNDNLTNYGFVKKDILKKILYNSSYAIVSSENLFSLFTIDAYNSGTHIIYNKSLKKYLPMKSNFFFHLNYNSKNTAKQLINILKKSKICRENIKFKNFLVYKRKKIVNFFKEYQNKLK